MPAIPFITSENAAAIGKLGAAARQRALTGPPDVRLVRARMNTLDRLMAEAKDSKEWDALSRAWERLFKAWQVLANVPGPGQYRPVAARASRRRVFELDAEIAQLKDAQPTATEQVTPENGSD